MSLVEERKNGSSSGSKSGSSFLQKLFPTSLRGTYQEKDGIGMIALGEDKMFLKTASGSYTGTYHAEGDELVFFMATDAEDTEIPTIDYRIIRNGDEITLKNTYSNSVYVREKDGFGVTQLLWIAAAVVGVIVVLLLLRALLRALRRRSRSRVPRDRQRAQTGGAGRTARKVVASAVQAGSKAKASAKDLGSAVATGVSAGVAAGKGIQRERKRIAVSPDTCCICGGSLATGAIPLAGLESGREAWIDRACLSKLQIMVQCESYEEFEETARWLGNQTQYLDPEVSSALLRFTKKHAARFYPPQESFEL
jgi:hypothetical protein